MKKICLRCYVSGRVQGVGFRYATADKALALGVTGYVRNLPDRRVEALICGDEPAVTALHRWLRQGPPAAQARDLYSETLPYQDFRDFRIE